MNLPKGILTERQHYVLKKIVIRAFVDKEPEAIKLYNEILEMTDTKKSATSHN